jgi:hypothetical protein
MRQQLFLLPLILFLTGFSNYIYCQSNYYPLEKGQVFTFAFGDDFNNGDSGLRSKIEFLESTTTINGKEYFVSQNSFGKDGNFTVVGKFYTRIGQNGSIYVLDSEDSSKESLTLDQPLSVGKSWEQSNMGTNTTVKVVDMNGSIKTPNKTYSNCLVLESIEQGNTYRSYFQKDVGSVAITMVVGGEEKVFTYLVNE